MACLTAIGQEFLIYWELLELSLNLDSNPVFLKNSRSKIHLGILLPKILL